MSPRVRRLLATLLLASPALAGDGHPFPVEKTDAEWRAQLGPERFHVMREQGTEAAYTGKGWNEHRPGVYRCAACGQLLFTSDAKFDSGTGWPSFTRPATPTSVVERPDRSLGMERTEVVCSRCGSHLGHVFEDGPAPTGLRYCMNAIALDFQPTNEAPPANIRR